MSATIFPFNHVDRQCHQRSGHKQWGFYLFLNWNQKWWTRASKCHKVCHGCKRVSLLGLENYMYEAGKEHQDFEAAHSNGSNLQRMSCLGGAWATSHEPSHTTSLVDWRSKQLFVWLVSAGRTPNTKSLHPPNSLSPPCEPSQSILAIVKPNKRMKYL